MQIHIGHSKTESILLDISGHSHPNSADSWEVGWLDARVQLSIGGFSGRLAGEIRVEELTIFHDELQELYQTLSGQATLSTVKGWLFIEIIGNGMGQMKLTGNIRDEPGIGNSLTFSLILDQTFLPEILQDLKNAIKSLPNIDNS